MIPKNLDYLADAQVTDQAPKYTYNVMGMHVCALDDPIPSQSYHTSGIYSKTIGKRKDGVEMIQYAWFTATPIASAESGPSGNSELVEKVRAA